jgi:hypothetical protein
MIRFIVALTLAFGGIVTFAMAMVFAVRMACWHTQESDQVFGFVLATIVLWVAAMIVEEG